MTLLAFTRVADGVDDYVESSHIAAFEADGAGGSLVYLTNNDNPLNITMTAPNIFVLLGPGIDFVTLARPNGANVYVSASLVQLCRVSPSAVGETYLFMLGRTQPIVIDDAVANVTLILNLAQAQYGAAVNTPMFIGMASIDIGGGTPVVAPVGFLTVAGFVPASGQYDLALSAGYINAAATYFFVASLAEAVTGQINVDSTAATTASVFTTNSAGVATDLPFTVAVYAVL